MSDLGGTFELLAPNDLPWGEIESTDPDLATVLAGSWTPTSSYEPVVVVAPARPLAGRVIDELGQPIAAARITLLLPQGIEARFGQALEGSVPRGWSATRDADGRFAFEKVPDFEGVHVAAEHDGYERSELPLPHVAHETMEIVLLRPKLGADALAGVVVDPNGTAVEGARVALGQRVTTSERDGGFSFELQGDDAAGTLKAVKPGFLPALLTAAPAGGGRGWPPFVTLKLGSAPLAIPGQVVDEDGQPVANVQVWVDDASFFGLIDGRPAYDELLLAGVTSPMWSPAVTGADGRFRLEGLLPRSYRVKAMDNRSLAMIEAPSVQAGGETLKLVLPLRDLRKVSGRVHARSGAGVGGVRVELKRRTFSAELDGSVWYQEASGAGTVTDGDGRFTLERVPKKGVFLVLGGDPIEPARFELEDGGDLDDLDIQVSLRLHFQIELDAPVERADHFRILGEDGEKLLVWRIRGGNTWSNDRPDLEGGKTTVLSVSEDARTLVLLHGDEEVGRHPIHLLPDELTTLHY